MLINYYMVRKKKLRRSKRVKRIKTRMMDNNTCAGQGSGKLIRCGYCMNKSGATRTLVKLLRGKSDIENIENRYVMGKWCQMNK